MLVSATPCLLKMVRGKTKLPPTKSIHCTLRAPWKNNIVNFERGTPTGQETIIIKEFRKHQINLQKNHGDNGRKV